jgi:hypothetical protein
VESDRVQLPEARRRVASVLGIEVLPWSAVEVKWIAANWGIFRDELRLCRELGEDLTRLRRGPRPLWWGLAAGVRWWLREAPVVDRAIVGTVGLWMVAFAWGWF